MSPRVLERAISRHSRLPCIRSEKPAKDETLQGKLLESFHGNRGIPTSMSGEGPPQGLDRRIAMARVGEDAALLQEIAALFLVESQKDLEQIRSAIAAAAAVEATQRLEVLGRAGNLEETPDALITLERTLHELCEELRTL